MNVEELILSGNYKKRLDPNDLDLNTDTMQTSKVLSNTAYTSPFKSPKAEEAEPIELDDAKEI